MEELKPLTEELSRLDDMIDMLESKIHNLVGLLELVYLGTRTLNRVDDSYELSSVKIMQNYLETIEKSDIQKLHEKLTDLKKQA